MCTVCSLPSACPRSAFHCLAAFFAPSGHVQPFAASLPHCLLCDHPPGGDASPAILQGMPLRTEDPYRNAPLRAVRVAGVYPYRGGKSLPREPARP